MGNKENKGCITCKKCEQVRLNFYCGRKKLSQKQLYKHGYCSKYEPRESAKAKPMTNEEWFCGLSTEEKAEWVTKNLSVYADDWVKSDEKLLNPATWVDWLNEVHK